MELKEERPTPSGRWIDLNVRHPPDGSTLVIATDITPYREAADALRMALEKERELTRLQRELVSMTSHEFRTPLAIIDGAVQRLMRRQNALPPDEFAELGADIRSAVARMIRLMDSILSTARLEDARIRFEPRPGDLQAIIREVCRRQTALAPRHAISVDADALPRRFVGDLNLLDVMLTNVLGNAVKFSPDGGSIEVRGRLEDGSAACAISDHGVGIPAADLPHVRERFYRARTATAIAGTGLGLSVVDKVVTLHGGSWTIASVEGRGTTVTIRLPLSGAQEEDLSLGDDRLHRG